jgi:hypothetical protein
MDEAWFHLIRCVSSQDLRMWASNNLNCILKQPLPAEKTSIWCGIAAERIIRPIYFEGTVDTAAYLSILSEFLEQLDNTELTQWYFQQDGATCHTSVEVIKSFFPRQNYFKEPMALLIARHDISRFLSLVLPEVMQEQTLHHESLEKQHPTGDHQH